jgi:Gpi18-like mannosyltransferase
MPRSRRSPKPATAPRVAAPAPAPAPAAPVTPPVAAAEPLVALPAISVRGLSDRAILSLIILASTILRLAIAPWGRYYEDSQVMAFRATRMATVPINQLYLTNSGVISHLPGDLWFLWYISNFYQALSPNGDFYGNTFLYLTKLVPIAFDAGAALALYLIARDLAGPRAGLVAAALYAFNPGPIIIASIWDQWDSISTCAALFALWFFLRNRYELAAATLTYAALVKPQFALFGLLFAIVFARRLLLPPLLPYLRSDTVQTPPRAILKPLARAGAAILAAWVTAELVLVPFNVSIPPLSAHFDLRDRLDYVFRVHDETTLNAFNFWATPWAGNGVNDWEVKFLGLTSRTWGQLLFGASLILILAMWWRRGTDRAIVWSALAMTFASYMLPTRIHERYLLPTVALAILVAAIQPRLIWFALALTATFTINLIAVYAMAHDARGAPFFARHNPGMTLMSLVNIGLFVWLLVRGPQVMEEEAPAVSRRAMLRRGQLVRARR